MCFGKWYLYKQNQLSILQFSAKIQKQYVFKIKSVFSNESSYISTSLRRIVTLIDKIQLMAEFQLKNMYDSDFYDRLSAAFLQHFPAFNKDQFLALIFDGNHEERELKERMHHTAIVMNEVLPGSYAKKISILKMVAPHLDDGFTGIIFPDFVETFGLEEENYDVSVDAMEHFTKYSSAEFAVRPFIKKYTERMMTQMMTWSKHENHHVRRLASEGCRPRLPWAMALPAFKKDPSMILPILEVLKNDEEDYVYRSVANNLNDISKDHPELVLEICERWKGNSKNTDWVVKHACRTLLKAGNPRAMKLFGFEDPANISIDNLTLEFPTLQLGGNQFFSFQLSHQMKKTAKIRLEFGVYFMKKNGKQNRKVFNITENTFEPNQVYDFKKKMHFKNLTTRKHYAGEHKISIIVNGVEKGMVDFKLLV
jgi:3-methyladenine DNA glycosylase AlkC